MIFPIEQSITLIVVGKIRVAGVTPIAVITKLKFKVYSSSDLNLKILMFSIVTNPSSAAVPVTSYLKKPQSGFK